MDGGPHGEAPPASAGGAPDAVVPVATLRSLARVVASISGASTLEAALQAVTDGVVACVGFGVALLNVIHSDGSFETVAVSGSEDCRRTLLGVRQKPDAYDGEFAVAERWGTLRFVPHQALSEALPHDIDYGWVPDIEVRDEPDAWHPLDALFAPLFDSAGALVGVLSVDLPDTGRRPDALQRELLEVFSAQAGVAIEKMRLIEALRANEERLREREETFRLAFEGAGVPMGILELRDDGAVCYSRVNDRLAELTGRPVEELESGVEIDLLLDEDREAEREVRVRLVARSRQQPGSRPVVKRQRRIVRPDGALRWVEITTAVVATTGDGVRALDQIEDVTERRRAEHELRRRARQDPLTGLPNRDELARRLARAAHVARRTGTRGAVLFCDLDGFKAVNDTHGHAVGDLTLVTVARRIAEQVRDSDLVARLGGDEFVVVAENVTEDEALALADRIREAVALPISTRQDGGDADVRVTVSVGIAPISSTGRGADALLALADGAMYRAKAAGRDAAVLADSEVAAGA